jgi:hypothetical protein
MERRLFTINRRDIGPELLATLATPIPHVESYDLTRLGIHRDPDPLLVGFLLHKAPHLIGFRFQAGYHHLSWLGGELGMQVIGTSREAFHEKVQEPRETDAPGTADPTEGEALAQQLFDPPALLGCHAPVEGIRGTLAAARFTLMVLFSMAGMAILLVSVRSTGGTRLSDDHGCW